MVRKMISIPERQDKFLDEMAAKLQISAGEFLRRMIDEYIKSYEKIKMGEKQNGSSGTAHSIPMV